MCMLPARGLPIPWILPACTLPSLSILTSNGRRQDGRGCGVPLTGCRRRAMRHVSHGRAWPGACDDSFIATAEIGKPAKFAYLQPEDYAVASQAHAASLAFPRPVFVHGRKPPLPQVRPSAEKTNSSANEDLASKTADAPNRQPTIAGFGLRRLRTRPRTQGEAVTEYWIPPSPLQPVVLGKLLWPFWLHLAPPG